jgi:cell division protein FtsZ
VDPDANIIVGSTLDTSMEGRIRVSVVATGIDAAAANKADVPVARRTMAAPLTLTPAHQAEVARPQPVVELPSVADTMPEVDDEFEASLFDAVASQAEIAAEAAAPADDLPPPAYRPQPAPQPTLIRSAPAAIEADAGDFVAPRPRPAGTPSPEALARLQAAVNRPAAGAAKFQRPAAVPPAAPAPSASAKPRFGIGSLINRMAGHLEQVGPAAAPISRPQPPVTAYDDDHEPDTDQDRIEIPAFLRRQAN